MNNLAYVDWSEKAQERDFAKLFSLVIQKYKGRLFIMPQILFWSFCMWFDWTRGFSVHLEGFRYEPFVLESWRSW